MLLRIGAIVLFCVCVYGLPNEEEEIEDEKDRLCMLYCTGFEYTCNNGSCYCANGFIPSYYQTHCVKCPGIGDKCWGTCCSDIIMDSVLCWQGTCQVCYDSYGNWICRESVDQLLVISTTQIVMATALIIVIFATFVLLYKLCAVPTVSPHDYTFGNRLSVGSLQIYVEERLRDAPPRYSRAPPTTTSQSSPSFISTDFVPDGSIPPPPYTPKSGDSTSPPNTALHI